MRTSLLIIAALFLGAFGAHFLMEDRGYVLFRFLGYSVETSVPVLVLGLILLYAVTRLVLRLLQAPRNIGRAAGAYRARAAHATRSPRGLRRSAPATGPRPRSCWLARPIAATHPPCITSAPPRPPRCRAQTAAATTG